MNRVKPSLIRRVLAAGVAATALAVLIGTALTAQGGATAELSNAIAVAGGRGMTCAIVTGGQVLCWGNNEHGQLGDGTTTRRLYPVAVEGLTGATQIRVSGEHGCVLNAAREVRCWGTNAVGQLGDGSTVNRSKPAPVPGLSGVTAIAVGRMHGCAVVGGGEVRCWGGNARGQLGDGTTTNRPSPVTVKGLTGVTAIEAGDAFHTCALARGGVYCWGWDHLGQLGGGKQNEPYNADNASATPIRVVAITDAVAIAVAGAGNSCALSAGGQMRCWGWNTFGQLGDRSSPPGAITNRVHSAMPAVVQGLSGVIGMTTASGTGQVCAILSDRTVQCWGHNGLGQRGDGQHVHRASPAPVPGLSEVTMVSGGADHTCAVAGGGRVRCWGYNNEGQLGDGTTINRPTPVAVQLAHKSFRPAPVKVEGLTGVTSIAAGASHSCALVDGRVRCWGSNARGQLGNGTTGPTSAVVEVRGLSTVTQISAGGDHTCAVTRGGVLSCWGWNGLGQLGDGSTVDRSAPVALPALSSVTAVAAGRHHTCAIVAGGEVRCWGHNYVGGPLGVRGGSQGGAIAHLSPVAVEGLKRAMAISAKGGHTCVIVDGGGMRCWGWGTDGQLGTGKPTAGPTPVSPEGVADVAAIAAGTEHTCALSAGRVNCWGVNVFGQLGDGTTTNRLTATPVQGLPSAVTSLAAGADHSCAVLADGQLSCWGWNASGQLGNGSTTDSSKPVLAIGLSRASAVAAGWGHTCALAGGSVYCWGQNQHGQLGPPERSSR